MWRIKSVFAVGDYVIKVGLQRSFMWVFEFIQINQLALKSRAERESENTVAFDKH